MNIMQIKQKEGKYMTDKSKYGQWEDAPITSSQDGWEDVTPANRYTYTRDIPTPITAKVQQPVNTSKLVELLSGGKANTWQNYMYGGETPESSTLGKAGQVIHNMGLEGLTGITPVGQVGSIVTNIGSNVPSILPKVTPYIEKAGKYVSPYTQKIADVANNIPSKVLGFVSRRDPEQYKVVYNVGKEGIPSVVKKFRAGQTDEILPESKMIYNYATSLGLPHEIAKEATHYRQEMEKGAWNLWNEYKNQNPLGLPDFGKANLAQKEYLAGNAGQHLGDLISPSKNAKQILEGQGILGGIGALTHSGAVISALTNPVVATGLAMQSPKLAAELAYRAGQTSRYLPSLLNAQIPSHLLLGELGLLSDRQGQ